MNQKITINFIRASMLVFWTVCLALFLMLPKIIALFNTERSINVYTWAGIVDPQLLVAFEQETGIKVNLNYYENNEELFVKLYTSGGYGADLLIPSDYIVEKLIRYNLIKPIDKTKIDFLDRLLPRLLHHYFDPTNTYTIPYYWSIYGIGINKDYFAQQPVPSWQLLFDCPLPGAKVGMLNAAREAILASALYLYGTYENLTQEKLETIKQTLIKQKKGVEAYIDADVRSNYMLITDGAPVAIATSQHISKAMQEYSNIDFIVPKEGSFWIIDNVAISRATKDEDAVYKLINYLYRPESLYWHFKHFYFFPVTNNLLDLVRKENVPESIIQVHFDETLPLYFFKDVIGETITNDIWVSVKTA